MVGKKHSSLIQYFLPVQQRSLTEKNNRSNKSQGTSAIVHPSSTPATQKQTCMLAIEDFKYKPTTLAPIKQILVLLSHWYASGNLCELIAIEVWFRKGLLSRNCSKITFISLVKYWTSSLINMQIIHWYSQIHDYWSHSWLFVKFWFPPATPDV